MNIFLSVGPGHNLHRRGVYGMSYSQMWREYARGFLIPLVRTLTLTCQSQSLPLNSRRWFAGNVVHHAGDAAYFVDDAVGDGG